MKTKLIVLVPFLVLFLASTVFADCRYDNENKEAIMKKALNNLEKIENASYCTFGQFWLPGDTIASDYHQLIREYNNPQDSTIGASFVWWNAEDTTKVEGSYDGTYHVSMWHEHRGAIIDDFKSRNLPFRTISPPFFNYTKSILRYALTTSDSISIEWEDTAEAYHFKMTIHEDKQVEFHGKACYMPENPYINGDPTSIYELWIDKKTYLPNKVRREMSTNTSETTCLNPELNKLPTSSIRATDYIPEGYEVRKYGEKRKDKSTSTLLGKKAPEWLLNDMNGHPVSLADLKSKVLLINFTGIGCGPCRVAIPFLNGLKDLFSIEDCSVVSVESWGNKLHSLRVYADKNQINYQFLEGNDTIIKDYLDGNRGVPVFFILDETRIIKKIVNGYNRETTGQELIQAIKEALRSN
ncbi:TlpA disulfide reductase family protein [uncultured Bacteroides sp.]|uniref:TlpA family protein disulfide reductase n=1 Tax=uncultured Bacteroides sp. TaxID=162156 RepID=UPI0025FB45FB|nr:TlpA disulfide reductase family protein [uncultured Bacteroides sp.]